MSENTNTSPAAAADDTEKLAAELLPFYLMVAATYNSSDATLVTLALPQDSLGLGELWRRDPELRNEWRLRAQALQALLVVAGLRVEIASKHKVRAAAKELMTAPAKPAFEPGG